MLSSPSPDTASAEEAIDSTVSLLISSIRCGSEHSLALTNDGRLFSFGWNEHGSCGSGDEIDQSVPCEVRLRNDENTLMANDRWVLIGAGCGHSFGMRKSSDD